MARAATFLFLLMALLSASAMEAGGITGKVTLLDHGRPRRDAAGVVVWVEGINTPARPRVRQMVSIHKRFEPRVIAVEKGGEVAFPNEDSIYHNVFSVSGRNRFDLGLYRRGHSRQVKFLYPGLVRVYCNIHPQMVGYIRVVDSSLYWVTEKDGEFSFDRVPEGTRTVWAWCEDGGETSRVVTLRAGSAAVADLTFDVSSFKPAPHKNKYGKDYPPPPPDEERY